MKKYVVVGIILLFIASTVTPAVISIDEPEKDDEYLEKLAYVCYDEYENIEFENYREISRGEIIEDSKSYDILISKETPQLLPLDGPIDSAWPMLCHDNRHTSLSPYSTAGNPFDEIWKFRCDQIEGGPVIGEDGTLYFGDMGSHGRDLYAVNPDGTEKWRYETDMWIWSAPAIAEDGTVYVTSFDDYLHALNPDGSLKWKFDAEDSIASSPAIAEDGTVYLGTMGDGCNIFAINPDGTEKWRYGTGYYITSDPAIGDDGTIYIGSGDDYFYAMNSNGTLKWRFETGGVIKGPASIADDGTVYVGSADDYLYALYPNGTMKWSYNIDYGTESNPSIGSDGTIYVGGKYLYAINPDGTEKWTFDFGSTHSHMSCPAISADGTIYIGTVFSPGSSNDGGEIIAVNPDGTEKWRNWIATSSVQSSPCIGEDGTVYIGSSSYVEGHAYSYGYLYAFNELDPDAPEAPTITGEINGQPGEEYDYTFSTTDPNGDDVYYYIEWGVREDKVLVGPYSSGEEITLSYSWGEEERPYIIISRAKDTDGHWGPYGELKVTMPVNQQSTHPMFYWFLERFPNAFPILRHLLEL